MFLKSKLPEFSPAVVEMERTFSPDLKGLIAWLETMPPTKTYCFISNGACLLAQFYQACGDTELNMGPFQYYSAKYPAGCKLPRGWNALANNGGTGRTFGEALVRARKLARS